jgi:hypothetical protein
VGLLSAHGLYTLPKSGDTTTKDSAVGFMVSTTTGTGGGGAGGLKNRRTHLVGGKTSAHMIDCLCPGMVLTVCVGTARNTHPISPTHPYDHRTTEATQRNKQTEKGSWLKQIGKISRVEKMESDRQRVCVCVGGGGGKKKREKKKTKTIGGRVKENEKEKGFTKT